MPRFPVAFAPSHFPMMPHAAYRFLDTSFIVQSDEPTFLEGFENTYRRFQIPDTDGLPVYSVSFYSREPYLDLDGQVFTTREARVLGLYAYSAILNAATARVRSHLLFHAASVKSPGGSGMIITGRSGLGKTTLTTTLLRRGFRFLSDDVTAVGREDGWLYPFPRGLGLTTPGQAKEKRFVDIDWVQPNSLGEPCPAKFLFVLAEPKDSSPHPQSAKEIAPFETYFVTLDRYENTWLKSIQAIPGVRSTRMIESLNLPVLRMEIDSGKLPEVEPQIEAACRSEQILLFDIAPAELGGLPNHNRDARLEPISASEAALELAANFKGGPRSEVLSQEYGGSPTRFFLALASLTTRMHCYRLQIGKLDQMVRLVVQTEETL